MLKEGVITSIHEFVNSAHKFDELNRWVWTEYAIQYDGTNESANDIAIFVGGYPYGVLGDKLKIVNTILMAQGRESKECIDEIGVGDWVVLTCGKIFGADNKYVKSTGIEIPFDRKRFDDIYGSVQYDKRPKKYSDPYLGWGFGEISPERKTIEAI